MRAVRHILFWAVAIVFLSLLFRNNFGGSLYSLYFICMLLPIIGGTFYFLNYYLIPRFLLQRRYFLFGLYVFYTLVVSIYMEILVMMFSFVFFANYNLGAMKPYASDVVILAMVMYSIVLSGTTVSTLHYFWRKEKEWKSMLEAKKREESEFIELRSERKTLKIPLHEIVFIESRADYLIFHLQTENSIQVRKRISQAEKELPGYFIRIHRSFIVNAKKVSEIAYEFVMIADTELPIGRHYRKPALERLKAN